MKIHLDAVVMETELDRGLSWENILAMQDMLSDSEKAQVLPIEIDSLSGQSSAVGFIALEAAEKLDYDFTILQDDLGQILADTHLESETHVYQIGGLTVYLGRQLPENRKTVDRKIGTNWVEAARRVLGEETVNALSDPQEFERWIQRMIWHVKKCDELTKRVPKTQEEEEK